MNTPNDRLEEFFQNSFQDFGAEPPVDTWERLEPLIPPKPRKNPFWKSLNGLFVFSLLGIITIALVIYTYERKLYNLEKRMAQLGQELTPISNDIKQTSTFDSQNLLADDLEDALEKTTPVYNSNNTSTIVKKTTQLKELAALDLDKKNIVDSNNTSSNVDLEKIANSKNKEQVVLVNLSNNIDPNTVKRINKQQNSTGARRVLLNNNENTTANSLHESQVGNSIRENLFANRVAYAFGNALKNTPATNAHLLEKVSGIVLSNGDKNKEKSINKVNTLDDVTMKIALASMIQGEALEQKSFVGLSDEIAKEFQIPIIKPFVKKPKQYLELSMNSFDMSSDYNSNYINLDNEQHSQSSFNSRILYGIQLSPESKWSLQIGLGWRKVNQYSQFSKDFFYVKDQEIFDQYNDPIIDYSYQGDFDGQNKNKLRQVSKDYLNFGNQNTLGSSVDMTEFKFEFASSFGNLPYYTKIKTQITFDENEIIEGHPLTVDYQTLHQLSFLQIPIFLQYKRGYQRLKYTMKAGVIFNRLIRGAYSIEKSEVINEDIPIRVSTIASRYYLGAGAKWANINLLLSAGLEYHIDNNLYFVLEPSLIRGQKTFHQRKYPWTTALNMGLRVQL